MTPLTDHEALSRMEAAQLEEGHALTTREQYQQWVTRYREARKQRIVRDLQGFLTHLSTTKNPRVNPKTVRQALCALKFYHEHVLGIEIPPNSLVVPKINKNRNIPVWLTHEEATDLINRMEGEARLQAELLYGTGSRITALLTARLKDVDMAQGLITFRHDKGGKSRTVNIPRHAMPRLHVHYEAMKLQWESDHRRGVICPTPEPDEMAKLGRRRYGTLPFYWLFPSQVVRDGERWHTTDHALTDGLKVAAEAARITKRVSPHVFRHSNATALLQRGENIRSIQEHLGHTHVETTEIYTHANGSHALISPMDFPPLPRPQQIVDFPQLRQA